MPSIEDSGYPLVYKAEENATPPPGLPENKIALRSEFRALDGMQKEVLVYDNRSNAVWRMVSDEGPYLNGTDLAPFPLAFYTAGMALSFTEELIRHAEAQGVTINNYQLTQDNFYTMQGSALRGDMIGGALPVEITVAIESDATTETIQKIVALAEQTSPAQTYMNQLLNNTFALNHNGQTIAVAEVTESANDFQPEPSAKLATAKPLDSSHFAEDIIIKQQAADTLFDVEGGAGSSLQATQKRTLHVRGICTLKDDGSKEVAVQLFKPIGSTFRFLSDGGNQSPDSLAYLSAGVGFCFMTQIGRYAQIVKQDLKAYSVIQDTAFNIQDDSAEAYPVDTQVYLSTGESDEAVQKTLSMSERTCFLHAAMRMSNRSNISIEFNQKKLVESTADA